MKKAHRLHFAGYNFTAGPEGTHIDRPPPPPPGLSAGDRVRYKDCNLTLVGTLETLEGTFCQVRWDRILSLSKEWVPNLKLAEESKPATPSGISGQERSYIMVYVQSAAGGLWHILCENGATVCGRSISPTRVVLIKKGEPVLVDGAVPRVCKLCDRMKDASTVVLATKGKSDVV